MENLIEECNKAIFEFSGNEDGIKRRQVFEDIKFMESAQGWNISLERLRDGHRVYYRYEDRKFSINNQILNETESNQLKEALTTLSKFKGLPQFEWVAEITARIDSGLGLSVHNQHIIEFEQNNYLKGLDFITPIYNAILYNQVIEIEYKSFKKNELQHFIIHPYFLKQYNNRWFFLGLNNLSDRIINLALDRIVAISNTKIEYKENATIDFNEYFEDVVGVTVSANNKVEHLVISVKNELIPYIETKPLHGSQKIKERTKTDTLITLELQLNYELEALLFSFGDGLQVLEPIDFRNKLTERINNLYQSYNNNADILHSKK